MISNKYIISVLLCFFLSFGFAQKSVHKQWKLNYTKGLNYLKQDSIALAWPYLESAYNLAKNYDNSKSKYSKTLTSFYEASILDRKYRIIDSLKLTDKVLAAAQILNNKKRGVYSEKLEIFADSLLISYQFKDAVKLYNERKSMLKISGSVTDKSYAKVLYGLGKSYKNDRSQTLTAKENLEQALAIIRSLDSEQNYETKDIRIELIKVYLDLDQIEKAEAMTAKSLELVALEHGKSSQTYANLLSRIANDHWDSELLQKASKYQLEAIEILDAINAPKDINYAFAKYILGLIERDKNNYERSILFMTEAYETILVLNNEVYDDALAVVIGNLSINYDKIGDYENALRYIDKALNVSKISPKSKSLRLMDKAYYYQNMGQYQSAHKFYDLALNSMLKSHGTSDEKYAKLLNNIGKLYFAEKNFESALTQFKKALEIIEAPEGMKWHNYYGYFLNDYAKTLFQLGETDEAIQLMQKNINYSDSLEKEKNEAYFNRKMNLATSYNLTGQYQKALPLIEESTENLKNILGESHVDYGQFLDVLSDTYFGLKNTDKAVETLKKSNDVFVNQIDKIFRFSSEKEKKEFLHMIMLNFNQMQSVALSKNLNNAKLNSINLNNQLMLKGLLLNNSKDILVKLMSLKDDDINNKINDYKYLKNKRIKLLTQYTKKSKRLADSLSEVINKQESELVKLYTSAFANSVSLKRNWEVIKKQLKADEVAIEFSHFNVLNDNKPTGEVAYVAYVFSATDSYPKMIRLFKEQQLQKVINRKSPDKVYNNDQLYALIWKPLIPSLKNFKTIYYVPSGLLNQISFAAISNHGQPIILNTKLVQLSSTYKLVDINQPSSHKTALLMGGITYDYKPSDKAQQTEEEDNQISFLDNSAITKLRGNKTRGESWSYLEGTEAEINALHKLLEQQNISISVLSKSEASETNLKKLSGQSPDVMHIATHGYFFENSNIDASLESDLTVEDQYRLAKDPLLRSGLILAGANYIWKHGKNLETKEDGILTAMEISNLDLSQTNLVVLSACETGLGDIDGSEGVYGLQRAFKMAGVDRLIMSLWEVPDTETSIFMNSFYNNWLNDNTIRDAFIKTQRQMSKLYAKSPSKWAAFVLFE